jgi:hypothetical protein
MVGTDAADTKGILADWRKHFDLIEDDDTLSS